MKIGKESVYIYFLNKDYKYTPNAHYNINIINFENDWIMIKNGVIRVKGTNNDGYAWNGCSPKYSICDMYFGTPEGIINKETKMPKTYYASMVHDILYQFSDEISKLGLKRKIADKVFYDVLNRDNFKMSYIYYLAVRLCGGKFWNKERKKNE